MFTDSWKEWKVLSMRARNLGGIFCSTTSWKVASREPTTEPAFMINSFSLLVSFTFISVPQHTTPKKMVLDNRLIKHQMDFSWSLAARSILNRAGPIYPLANIGLSHYIWLCDSLLESYKMKNIKRKPIKRQPAWHWCLTILALKIPLATFFLCGSFFGNGGNNKQYASTIRKHNHHKHNVNTPTTLTQLSFM